MKTGIAWTQAKTRLQVDLKMLADISPVTPPSPSTRQRAIFGLGSRRNGKAGGVYCVQPGIYGVNVRDASGARQDVRNEYELTIQTENPIRSSLIIQSMQPLSWSTPQTGYVSCANDADWFRFQIDKRLLVTVTFTMDNAQFQPRLQILTPKTTSF